MDNIEVFTNLLKDPNILSYVVQRLNEDLSSGHINRVVENIAISLPPSSSSLQLPPPPPPPPSSSSLQPQSQPEPQPPQLPLQSPPVLPPPQSPPVLPPPQSPPVLPPPQSPPVLPTSSLSPSSPPSSTITSNVSMDCTSASTPAITSAITTTNYSNRSNSPTWLEIIDGSNIPSTLNTEEDPLSRSSSSNSSFTSLTSCSGPPSDDLLNPSSQTRVTRATEDQYHHHHHLHNGGRSSESATSRRPAAPRQCLSNSALMRIRSSVGAFVVATAEESAAAAAASSSRGTAMSLSSRDRPPQSCFDTVKKYKKYTISMMCDWPQLRMVVVELYKVQSYILQVVVASSVARKVFVGTPYNVDTGRCQQVPAAVLSSWDKRSQVIYRQGLMFNTDIYPSLISEWIINNTTHSGSSVPVILSTGAYNNSGVDRFFTSFSTFETKHGITCAEKGCDKRVILLSLSTGATAEFGTCFEHRRLAKGPICLYMPILLDMKVHTRGININMFKFIQTFIGRRCDIPDDMSWYKRPWTSILSFKKECKSNTESKQILLLRMHRCVVNDDHHLWSELDGVSTNVDIIRCMIPVLASSPDMSEFQR